MNTIELNAIAKKFGTPTFLFDTEALRKRMANVKEIVGENDPDIAAERTALDFRTFLSNRQLF